MYVELKKKKKVGKECYFHSSKTKKDELYTSPAPKSFDSWYSSYFVCGMGPLFTLQLLISALIV